MYLHRLSENSPLWEEAWLKHNTTFFTLPAGIYYQTCISQPNWLPDVFVNTNVWLCFNIIVVINFGLSLSNKLSPLENTGVFWFWPLRLCFEIHTKYLKIDFLFFVPFLQASWVCGKKKKLDAAPELMGLLVILFKRSWLMICRVSLCLFCGFIGNVDANNSARPALKRIRLRWPPKMVFVSGLAASWCHSSWSE